MEELTPLFLLMREEGYFTFFLNVIVGVGTLEIIRKREELSRITIHLLNKWVIFCEDAIQWQRKKRIEALSSRISDIYTYLYALAQLSPIRAIVIKAVYYPKQKFWKIWAVHEADFSMQPYLKPQLQGIQADPQTIDFFISQPLRDGETYAPNIGKMEAGQLKDLLSSLSIMSFFALHLGSSDRRFYSLILTFNRANALSNAEKSRARLVAANIQNLIFAANG